ncbi:hypothetical protein QQZ08_009099 [Neonectria magnoliae]|uniref:Uncharacterized protein n=1 Tax=Neonectria magnoliae TaxID=2732573 RepID=A0ABR1HS60_9HYPO
MSYSIASGDHSGDHPGDHSGVFSHAAAPDTNPSTVAPEPKITIKFTTVKKLFEEIDNTSGDALIVHNVSLPDYDKICQELTLGYSEGLQPQSTEWDWILSGHQQLVQLGEQMVTQMEMWVKETQLALLEFQPAAVVLGQHLSLRQDTPKL